MQHVERLGSGLTSRSERGLGSWYRLLLRHSGSRLAPLAALRRRWSGVSLRSDVAERCLDVCDEANERLLLGTVECDDDVIEIFARGARERCSHRFLQTTPDPVTRDRIAELFGDREAETRSRCRVQAVCCDTRFACLCLNEERRFAYAVAAAHGEEVSTDFNRC